MRDLLSQPLARDCRSWSSDPGKRKSREGGSCSARAREDGGGQNKTKTHLKVKLVPSVWAAGPGRDSAGLKKWLCHVYLWLLMMTGSNLWELLWSNPCKAPWWWWGQDQRLQETHTCTHLYTLLQGCASWLDYFYHLHIKIKWLWFRNPTINPYQKITFIALAIMVDCQTHTPKDPWSYRLWYYTKISCWSENQKRFNV